MNDIEGLKELLSKKDELIPTPYVPIQFGMTYKNNETGRYLKPERIVKMPASGDTFVYYSSINKSTFEEEHFICSLKEWKSEINVFTPGSYLANNLFATEKVPLYEPTSKMEIKVTKREKELILKILSRGKQNG